MEDKIQNKINHFMQLAKSPVNIGQPKATGSIRANDSLSKAIRNPEEAAVFMNELNAIVEFARKK